MTNQAISFIAEFRKELEHQSSAALAIILEQLEAGPLTPLTTAITRWCKAIIADRGFNPDFTDAAELKTLIPVLRDAIQARPRN